MQAWVVIKPDGGQIPWIGTWKSKLLHRFPKVDKDNLLWLDGFPYVPNPTRNTRETYRPLRYLGLIEKEDHYAYWRYQEPDQVTFDQAMTPTSIGITGDTIKQYAQMLHLSQLAGEDTNWYAIIAIMAVLGLIVSIAAWYFNK